MENQELELLLETIRKEHRRTQIVFGVGIIILCIVVAVIAPIAIRSIIFSSQSDVNPTDQPTLTGQPQAGGTPTNTAQMASTTGAVKLK